MQIEFDKMEGAGNDFVLIDNRDGRLSHERKTRLAVAYCRRHQGIGADGMVFIEKDPELDFAWDCVNPDGSRAGMCGNAARCTARFAHTIGAAGKKMAFRTPFGRIDAELTPTGSRIGMPNVAVPAGPDVVEVDGAPTAIWFLDVGVPIAVIETPDVDVAEVGRIGPIVRHHAHFAPAGANVTFFTAKDGNRIATRTYERGVEEETLACGTGSVAASLVSKRLFSKESPVTVSTLSGEDLIVSFRLEGGEARDVWLEGGARLVFSGEFEV